MPFARDGRPKLDIELPANPTSISRIRRAAMKLARQAGAAEHDVGVAVSEAATNSVLHAFVPGSPGAIRLSGRLHPGRLTISVADNGRGTGAVSDHVGLGLGMRIISRVASEVCLHSSASGTVISMSFPVAPGDRQPDRQAAR